MYFDGTTTYVLRRVLDDEQVCLILLDLVDMLHIAIQVTSLYIKSPITSYFRE